MPRPARKNHINGVKAAAFALIFAAVAPGLARVASAQRPFQIYDSFYRDEKASRQYYDRFALTGEVAYNPARATPGEGLASIRPDAFGYSVRFEYQLAEHFDLGVVMDAFGNEAGRSLGVSWVQFKYYRTVDQGDYALRLALDPASDGQGGFPQLDAAFIYSSLLSPEVSTRFTLGGRRVSVGYERLVPLDGPENPTQVSPLLPGYGIIPARAIGWEIHAVMAYIAHFDPGGSHIYFSLLGEAGSYELIDEVVPDAAVDGDDDEAGTSDFRAGVIWLRSGLEYSRPRFVITPFIGLPLRQWEPEDGDWARHRLQIGVRIMIR